ncbi:DUF1616 domain-containing protein [Methanomethylovorans sp.]|uniref:DUF1616 domain-containing protein n=1 Tax=Methanomethylovorans sp. TaxID=2758717 RepID=UPI00345EC687
MRFLKDSSSYIYDLIVVFLLSLFSVLFILISPFNETPLRIIFALLLIFFIPGYAFISAMFPKEGELSEIERFTLSVGFSIVIMVFDGFIISVTSWKFRPNSITLSLTLVTSVLLLIAYLNRRRFKEDERYYVTIRKIKAYLGFGEAEISKEIPAVLDDEDSAPRFRVKNKRSMVPKKKAAAKPSEDPSIQITKVLTIALVLSIIIAFSMFAYAKINREKEQFTALYILGPGGKAENYQLNVTLGEPAVYTVGIENYELEDVNYTLQVKLDDVVLSTTHISVADGQKVLKNITYVPKQLKSGRSRLQFNLFKDDDQRTVYRSVHLWIEHVYSITDIKKNIEKFALDTVPVLINGNMEAGNGWEFDISHPGVTANYSSGTGWDGTRSLNIVSTMDGSSPSYFETYHGISQTVKSQGNGSVILSLYMNDNFDRNVTAEAETQFKQILINGHLLWEDGIGGMEGWQRIEIPVSLVTGDNTLSIGLMQKGDARVVPVTIAIDDVKLKPVSELSDYVGTDGTIETIPPVSSVTAPGYVTTEQFELRWSGTDTGSGIRFFDIEYSKDQDTWEPLLNATERTSTLFNGKNGTTYYFRSTAYDRAGNKELPKSTYDASVRVHVGGSAMDLDITPNPTKGYTRLTLTSSVPLLDLRCMVTPEGFKQEVTTVAMTSTDGITWTGNYLATLGGIHNVEISAMDVTNNTVSLLETIYVDLDLSSMTVQVEPGTLSKGTVYVMVKTAEALDKEPTIHIRDRNNTRLLYKAPELENDVYTFEAEVNTSLAEGIARVDITAYTVGSEKLTAGTTFIIDRTAPEITSIFPADGDTISGGTVAITADIRERTTSVDLNSVQLKVNGQDVTGDAIVSSNSIVCNARDLSSGTYAVELYLQDEAGNSASHSWTFNVN